ncbi:unnamed protein product [Prorocentrum cordatum]|uniref:Neurotransmitter-gated ion-channel ligand-binding domain-containing protein n=1 Tax=Prorocentrum cordatum TaxID=2364126 RepID=A0ABN9WBA1_9DINO|nr:unnamed protein product [Polarella glacialis]
MEEESMDEGNLKVWSPAHGPRQVFFSMVVKLLYDIDNVNQRFSAKILLRFQWMLSEEEMRSWEADHRRFKAEWTPPVVDVRNSMDMSVEQSEVSVGMLGNMLIGKCTQALSGTFLEVMELQRFPFDHQEFTVILQFPDSDEKFQLRPAADQPRFVQMPQDPQLLPEYVFSNPVLELGSTSFEELQHDFKYKTISQPTLVLRLQACRSWMSYVNKIVITLALVSAAVILAFLIPSGDLADRLAHATTLFLTAIAFQLVVSTSLPQIDYMTVMDKYIMHLNVFILSVMGSMSFLGWAGQQDDWEAESIADLDRYALIVALCMWCAIHGLLGYRGWHALRCSQSVGIVSSSGSSMPSLSASSQYTMVVGATQKFFGSFPEYQAEANIANDFTFWTGIWYSKDFYGPHGIEYVFFFMESDHEGKAQLMARKITGDNNVPCGEISIRTTNGVPELGGSSVPFEVKVREDTSDPEGFFWVTSGSMRAHSLNQLNIYYESLPTVVSSTFVRQFSIS